MIAALPTQPEQQADSIAATSGSFDGAGGFAGGEPAAPEPAPADAENSLEVPNPTAVEPPTPPEPVTAEPAEAESRPEPIAPPNDEIPRVAITPTQQLSLAGVAAQVDRAGARLSREHELQTLATTGSLGVFSVGYLWWAIRGGSLLGSVLLAMPAWQSIDPIPVLEFAARKREDVTEENDENKIDGLFNRSSRTLRQRAGGSA